MSEPCDCDDGGMLGDVIGRPNWPVVALVIAVIAALAFVSWQHHHDDTERDTQLIEACADHGNVKRCVDDLQGAL